jgi:4-alpha-glucanotransferase
MNTPGETSGNWAWRLEPGQLTAEHAVRLRAVTARTERTA